MDVVGAAKVLLLKASDIRAAIAILDQAKLVVGSRVEFVFMVDAIDVVVVVVDDNLDVLADCKCRNVVRSGQLVAAGW